MASRADIKAGSAYILLSLNQGDLKRSLKSIEASFRSLGSGLTSVGMKMLAGGGAVAGGLAAMAATFTSAGDSADKMVQRTGMTAESITQLTFAAESNDIAITDVEASFRKFQKTLGAAAEGSKEAAAKILDLGLSVDQLAALSPDAQFEAIADALAKIDGPTNRAAAAMGIFGKSGTALLPMLEGGADGLQVFRQKADDLGISMNAGAIQAAVEMDDAVDDLHGSVTGLTRSLGSALVPMLTKFAKTATAGIVAFGKFIREHEDFIRSIAKGAAAVVAGGAAALVLGKMFTLAAGAVGFLSPAILALATPLGAVAALIIGGAFAWLKWSDSGKKAAGEIGSTLTKTRDYFSTLFGDIGDVAGATWKGIVDAVSSGDLALAGEVAMAGLALVWEQGTKELQAMWVDTKWFFLTVWGEATTGIAKGFFEAIGEIEKAWVNVISVFGSTWDSFLANMLPSLNSIGQGIEDTITNAMEAAGLITSEGAERMRNSTAAKFAAEQKDIIDPAKKRLDEGEAKREEDRKKRLADIDAKTSGMAKTLGEDRATAQKGLDDDAAKSLDDKQKALDEARKRLADLKMKTDALAASKRPGIGGEDGAGDELSKRGASVAGSFFSSALFGLVAGSGQDKAIKVAEKTRDIAKDHLEQAKVLVGLMRGFMGIGTFK